jgi:hypothetical protein
MKRFALVAATIVAAACGGKDITGVGTPVPTIPVTFSGGTITAFIASTSAARTNGLMGTTSLGANSGMLFVFAASHAPSDCAFYMKDTPTPLSIAFIDSTMTVINLDDMAAEDSITLHKPARACQYAVEANLGWFASHGVAAGSTVTFALPAGTIVDP